MLKNAAKTGRTTRSQKKCQDNRTLKKNNANLFGEEMKNLRHELIKGDDTVAKDNVSETGDMPTDCLKKEEISELIGWIDDKEREIAGKEHFLASKEKDIFEREKNLKKSIEILRHEEIANINIIKEFDDMKTKIEDEENNFVKQLKELEAKEKEIEKRERQADEREASFAEKQKDILERSADIEKTEKELSGKEDSLVGRIAEFENKETAMSKRQAELKTMQDKVNKVHKSAKETMALVSTKEKELARKIKQLDDMEKAAQKKAEEKIKDIRIKIKDDIGLIQERSKELKAKETDISRKEMVLKEKENIISKIEQSFNQKLAGLEEQSKKILMQKAEIAKAMKLVEEISKYKSMIDSLKKTYDTLRKKVKEEYADHSARISGNGQPGNDNAIYGNDSAIEDASSRPILLSKGKPASADANYKSSYAAPRQQRQADENKVVMETAQLLDNAYGELHKGDIDNAQKTVSAIRANIDKLSDANSNKKELDYNLKMLETEIKLTSLAQ